MKKLLIIIFIFFAKTTFAQKDTVGLNIPIIDGAVVYQKVFNVPDKSKDALFNDAQLWYLDNFKNTRGPQIEDKDFGRIVAKSSIPFTLKATFGVKVLYNNNFTIQIDCKDNKYRCRIYDMTMSDASGGKDQAIFTPESLINQITGKESNFGGLSKNQSKETLQNLNASILDLIASLDKRMAAADDF
jgi:hypothetical protein